MLEELLQTLFLLSFSLGAGLLFLFLRRQILRQSNHICAAFILVSLVPLWNGYFRYTDDLTFLSSPILELMYPWLFGPLLYLYCLSLQSIDSISLRRVALHCSYPLLILILRGLMVWSEQASLAQFWNHIYLKLLYAQIFIYLLLAFRQVRIGQKHCEQLFAGNQNLYWRWLMLLIKGFAFIFVADLVMLYISLTGTIEGDWIMVLFTLAESIYVFVLVGYAIRYPQLVFDRFDVSHKARYQNSGLNQSLAQSLAKRLEERTLNEKLYLDNDLSLTSLAQQLHIPEHHLSQVLSEQLNQNFYEFINRHRIEHAKTLLASNAPQYSNILDLAFGVGFNNKSSFNAAFKRFTQMTPSQFKHHQSLNSN